MRLYRSLVFSALGLFFPLFLSSMASAQVTFHGAGIANSAVRDATKVGTVIYAVGASGAGTSVNPSSASLWTFDGLNPVSLTLLPNFASGTTGTVAGAITPDAVHIASQARNLSSPPTAVRVTRSLLPNVTANLNLNAAPYSVFTPQTLVRAMSIDGSILYGNVNNNARAARFDTITGTSALIPLLNTTVAPIDTANPVAARGTSSDGSVVVGTSTTPPYGGTTNGRAFRYVQGVGVSAIPLLDGGTWNKALAVSPDGNLTLVGGNSTLLPMGEMYLYNSATSLTTRLGSPNTPWEPFQAAGGMTADGSVVVVTYSAHGFASHYSYFHNSHGWFHLASALAAGGVNLAGMDWQMDTVFGLSYDGTLVYGQGRHNGAPEGFVAEFPVGFLAEFSAAPIAPTDTSVVGAWLFADVTPAANPAIVVLLANGSYFEIEANVPASELGGTNGFERGNYTVGPGGAFAVDTKQDTNGDVGLSGLTGMSGATFVVAGDTATVTLCSPALSSDCGPFFGTRIAGGAGSLAGGWISGNPAVNDSSTVLVLLNDGTFYFAEDGDSGLDPSGHDGIEFGSFLWNSITGVFSTTMTVDSNGQWGLSNPTGSLIVNLSPDELSATVHDDSPGVTTITRIADPNTVRPTITSLLSATGTVGTPFAYTITATRGAFDFDAGGLPGGLTIDSPTGVISGTPTPFGSFDVTLTASNTLSTGTATLNLVIDRAQQVTLLVTGAPGSSTYNSSFTVDVSGGSGSGTVTFDASGACSNTANGALITITSGTGTCLIAATKAGDASFNPKTSAEVSVAAMPAAQDPLAVTGAPASAAYGASFTVDTTGGSGIGAVTFSASGACSNTADGAFITMTSGAGTCSITATKAGDPNYLSADASVTPAASQAPLTVTADNASIVYGSLIPSLSASIAGFVNGDNSSVVSGSAVCTTAATSSSTVATYPIACSVGTLAAVNYSFNFAEGVLTITQASTATTVRSNRNPSNFGQSVNFTATVTSPAGVPTGTMTFSDGAISLGASAVVNGLASLSINTLSGGSHSVTAAYSGDTNFQVSASGALTQVVAAPTTTVAASAANPTVFGQTVNLTASVTSGIGIPGGSVTFKDGNSSLGSATLNLAGSAALQVSSLAIGSHSITVVYGGNSNFMTSTSAPLSQVISKAATLSVFTSVAAPSVFGQSVSFAVNVSAVAPGAGTPTGSVTFTDSTTSTTLGSQTLSGGNATLTVATLGVGTHAIVAVFAGSGNFLTSTSAPVSQSVNKAGTTSTLGSSRNPSNPGKSVTFTATVIATSPGTGTPTGSVTFFDGATPIGTASLGNKGAAALSTSSLATGSHSIHAEYGGAASYQGSSSANVIQQVN